MQESGHYIASSNCCRVFPNAVGRSKGERQSFVGEQIVSYPDASSLSLKRPFDRYETLKCSMIAHQTRNAC